MPASDDKASCCFLGSHKDKTISSSSSEVKQGKSSAFGIVICTLNFLRKIHICPRLWINIRDPDFYITKTRYICIKYKIIIQKYAAGTL